MLQAILCRRDTRNFVLLVLDMTVIVCIRGIGARVSKARVCVRMERIWLLLRPVSRLRVKPDCFENVPNELFY
jgi:hypothetical protein